MVENKWLARRNGGETWYCVKAVPRPLRAALGKSNLIESLQTTDIRLARARRHAVLQRFEAILAEARGPARVRSDLDAALSWSKVWPEIDAGHVAGLDDDRPAGADPKDWARFVASGAIDDHADDVAGERYKAALPKHGPVVARRLAEAAAEEFRGIARGVATPLLLHLDGWLAEGGKKGKLNGRTANQYRADLKALEVWLAGEGITTLESVTRAVAGRWVSTELVGKGEHPVTSNKRITAAGSYWRHLIKRGLAPEPSPWAGQLLAKPARRTGVARDKRASTEAEVATLLSGKADAEMQDAMRVAALSGMRLGELYGLTVADCAGGWFRIGRAKTDAGVRRVPVHSALAGIVARRTEGKTPGDYLFHEAPPSREGRERSSVLSKRFGHYRQRVGVHDRAEGKRHSAVDFHSFRRRFATAALNAGILQHVVDAVCGWQPQGMALGVYHSGYPDELLRACVEAVGLPEPGDGGAL